MTRLPPAPDLRWDEAGAPVSTRFDDIYFSRQGGLAESEAVFLGGCGLPAAWRNKPRFAIGELGFGAGLNVLAAWRAWKATRSAYATLHISTIEAFPLARADAARALAQFPELDEFSRQLLARWPVRAYAPQRFWFAEDGFALTILTGDAAALLAGMVGRFDAWFLDGFTPARNPALWEPGIFSHVARLSRPGARLATFTAAGTVRRGLESAGFSVSKKPGFGGKQERLEAVFGGPPTEPEPMLYPYAACEPRRVAVIGAGIAGAACARALSRRNVETVILEAAPAPASGASGNPAGLVMPRLDRSGALSEVLLAAYLDAVALYASLGSEVFTACGVEQVPHGRNAAALADLAADPPLPEDWIAALEHGGLLHPRAGVVYPRAAVAALLDGAKLLCEAEVAALERAPGGWVVRAPDGRAMLMADAVVLACGPGLARFAGAAFLPLQLSRGQVEWGVGAAPVRAKAAGNYLAPFAGGVLFGATFDTVVDEHQAVDAAGARQRNLAALRHLAPAIAASIDPAALRSKTGLRAALPDRAPIAGLLPDAPAWLAQCQPLASGRRTGAAAPPSHAGLYVLGGLGARGFVNAPLLAERIVAEMCGEPQLLSQRALDAIHPARFLLRTPKRQ